MYKWDLDKTARASNKKHYKITKCLNLVLRKQMVDSWKSCQILFILHYRTFRTLELYIMNSPVYKHSQK